MISEPGNKENGLAAQIEEDSAVTLAEAEALQHRGENWAPEAEMSAEEVAQGFWKFGVNYSQASEVYEDLWWDRLPSSLRKAIKQAGQQFSTVDDLRAAHLAEISVPLNARPANLARIWQTSTLSEPTISLAQFCTLASLSPDRQRRWIAGRFEALRMAANQMFGLAAHRAASVTERDWEMTRNVVDGGMTMTEAWRKWVKEHPDANLTMDAALEAIKRTKLKFEGDRFMRWLHIYILNFPVIRELTCSCQTVQHPELPCLRCGGSSRVAPF
jgi:hypothetical protein